MPGWMSYSFLLGMAVKSTAVLAAAMLAILLMRKRSAAMRHVVWSAAFAAILALPLLAMWLPALRVPVGDTLLGPAFRFAANSSPVAPASTQTLHSKSIQPEPQMPHANLDWLSCLVLVWAGGSAVSFAQIVFGWAAIRRVRRGANPLNEMGLTPLARLLHIQQKVTVLEAPRGSMPITCGLLRPTIFVPADISEWNEERRRMVLLHELAHVRRHDVATHLIARAALSVYWWNPAAWIAWRESLNDRERAADDLVLGAGACASDYATHLLEIARSMQQPPATALAGVPMARRSQLEGRLLSILDVSVDRGSTLRVSPFLASLLAIGMIAPLAAMHAQSSTAQTPASLAASSNSFLGIITSGDAAREHRQYDQAKALYTKALAVSANTSETATAYLRLGMVEVANKNVAQAMDDFEQAKRANPEQTAEADMWMAIAQRSQNNLQDADALYQSALAAEDPDSTAAATTMELYALLLRQEAKQQEANTMQAQAAAIRQQHTPVTSQTSGPDVYNIGGDVKAPILLSKVEPDYTEVARIAKYQGTALLAVEISADGLPRNIHVIRALGFGLDQKAIQAVTQWKFEPATKDGESVAVRAQIEVNFRLL